MVQFGMDWVPGILENEVLPSMLQLHSLRRTAEDWKQPPAAKSSS